MSDLQIEVCPETGICSIVRSGKEKVDLMPNEVADIKEAAADAARIRGTIADADSTFAQGLTEDELAAIAKRIG